MGPLETGTSDFPEEDLRAELVDGGEPMLTSLGAVLARFDVAASDRAAIGEIEEWFEELGIAAEPRLLDAGRRRRKLTLYMREWGPPGPPEPAPSAGSGPGPEPRRGSRLKRARAKLRRSNGASASVAPPPADDPALAAQLAEETGMPLEAAAGVIAKFDAGSEFVARLRERAAELEPRPEPEPQPERVGKPAAPPRRRRATRIASWVMFVAGGLLLLEAGVTVVWQEPFSAFYSARAQARLEDRLDDLEAAERGREAADKRRLLAGERRQERGAKGLISSRLKSEQRVVALADSFSRRIGEGKPLGEISIPRMGMKQVMVQGTQPQTLRQGPGHYSGTVMPGQSGTVGIAGHRSTYSAPFKKLNELKQGDEVFVKVPYGLFTYRIEGTKIISPSNVGAFRRAGYDRLMMTACHPVFSDKQRIIAWGRLKKVEPRGAAVL